MSEKSLSTDLIHTGDGQFQKRLNQTASVPETFPIYLTSVYAFDDLPSLEAAGGNDATGYIYTRQASPNADAVSQIIAAAEGCEKALVFSSGMAAIALSILAFVQTGDHIVASAVLYGGVYDFLSSELPRLGIQVSFIDPLREDIGAYIRPNTRLVYLETISNPLMETPDIEAIAKSAHRHGLAVFVDNTFAPIVARPLSLGADVVLYSATKYLGGHSDITGGAIASSSENVQKIKRLLALYGAVLGPVDCWLLARSLRTLDLRIRKHCENALAAAKFLQAHPKVETVFYPGLPSSPSFAAAKRQFHPGLFGGMLSVSIKGGEAEASALLRELSFIPFAPSLAGTSTTVSYPVKTSHKWYDKKALDALGITAGLLRFSIGLEGEKDIIEELERALNNAF